jgi:hypothetical protein
MIENTPIGKATAPPTLSLPPDLAPARPASHWFKRVLACNPFYLVSAALLLFGFYRVSVDPGFLKTEVSQLIFNYSSLQLYELLLAVTAILLAWRRVWYDSTLLVGLENLLVLVPFILISQAALIGPQLVWALCAAGAAVACARFGGLKRFIPQLNFPSRFVQMGALILLVNAFLPAVYRVLHEYKFGTRPDWGAAYQTNQFAWLLLLPALCALANYLPPAREAGSLWPQNRFVPIGFFSLWLAGTIVHLYCLGYIYDFSLRSMLVAPVVWTLLWTAYRRMPDFVPDTYCKWQTPLLILPALATLAAASPSGNAVFLTLAAANVAIYGRLYYLNRGHRLTLALLCLSGLTLLGGLPANWAHAVTPGFDRAKFLAAVVTAGFLLWTLRSRNPKLGVLGALAAAASVFFLLGESTRSLHWAAQVGLIFGLLHSLRWVDSSNEGAGSIRISAALIWAAHSFWWLHDAGAPLAICASAAPVLVIYLAARCLSGHWGPWPVPIAAIMVLLSGPSDFTAGKLQDTSTGVLAVAGSFLLFGLGTLAALTKQYWHKPNG